MFKPGEKALLVYADPSHNLHLPIEVTVLSKVHDSIQNRVAYEIDISGYPCPYGAPWLIPEEYLRKKIPPNWEKTTWDQCIWKPSCVTVERSR
ncbi:MAG: hypothetical protein QXL17_02940 [Candidatus Thermoplasmatota archaeon]